MGHKDCFSRQGQAQRLWRFLLPVTISADPLYGQVGLGCPQTRRIAGMIAQMEHLIRLLLCDRLQHQIQSSVGV